MANPVVAGKPTMRVKIYAPFKTYFDGQALSLTAVNLTGPFDVLPRHKNFMSLLMPCNVVVRLPDKQAFSMQIGQAVMHVKADQVTVFLDV